MIDLRSWFKITGLFLLHFPEKLVKATNFKVFTIFLTLKYGIYVGISENHSFDTLF